MTWAEHRHVFGRAVSLVWAMMFTGAVAWGQLSPAPIGELPPVTFGKESEPTNLLTTSVQLLATYDDNLLLDNSRPVRDLTYEIRPGISFRITRDRLRWTLNARPGLAIHQAVGQRDLFTNSFGTDFEYDLSKRLTARFRSRYIVKDDPLSDTALQASSGTNFNFLDQPNDIVITPQVKRTSEQFGMDVTYKLDERSVVQVAGTFYNLKFDQPPDSTVQLTNNQFTSGRALYSRRISRRMTAGFIYDFQDIASFGSQDARSVTHSFLYSHAIEFSSSTALQLFAGPERTRTDQFLSLSFLGGTLFLPVETSNWSWAAGSSVSWTGRHTGVRLTFRRQVQNGGGLETAARRTSGGIEFRRTLGAGWFSGLGFIYGENQLLDLSSQSFTKSFALNASLRHRLGKDFWADLLYARGHQEGGGLGVNHSGDADRITLSVEYEFKNTLGR